VTEASEQDKPDGEASAGPPLTVEEHDEFERLLDYLKRNRGFDFTGYKRASLVRRVSARLKAVQLESFGQYLDFLQVDPDEFTALFDTILINVTGFFRDPAAWEYLASDVVPGILAAKDVPEPIRMWSAGCATGEEAYTLAIIMAEVLGVDEMRQRVKIYGTDVDEGALAVARHATYTPKAVSGLPERVVETYFERSGANYVFRHDLRRTLGMRQHDNAGVVRAQRADLGGGEAFVHLAMAGPADDLDAGLGGDVLREIFVGQHDDAVDAQ